MAKEKVKFLRRDNLWITFLMDCKHFEIVHVYRYIYIFKEFLSRCKNRNSLGMCQKNQMKIQDRGEGNVLEKS